MNSNVFVADKGPRRGRHFNRRGPDLEYAVTSKSCAEEVAETKREMQLEGKSCFCKDLEKSWVRRVYGVGEMVNGAMTIPSPALPHPAKSVKRRPPCPKPVAKPVYPGGWNTGVPYQQMLPNQQMMPFNGAMPPNAGMVKSMQPQGMMLDSHGAVGMHNFPPPPTYQPGQSQQTGGRRGSFTMNKPKGGGPGPHSDQQMPIGASIQGAQQGPTAGPLTPQQSPTAYVSPTGYAPCHDTLRTVTNAGTARNAGMQASPAFSNRMLHDPRGINPTQYRPACS